MISNPVQMDYAQLMTLGNSEREKATTELKERLARLSPYETMKRQAELTESLLQVKKYKPLGIYVK